MLSKRYSVKRTDGQLGFTVSYGDSPRAAGLENPARAECEYAARQLLDKIAWDRGGFYAPVEDIAQIRPLIDAAERVPGYAVAPNRRGDDVELSVTVYAAPTV